MEHPSVFNFTDYREYLQSCFPVIGEGRGQRTLLAQALNCQNGFVSLVLSGRSEFSMEHGVRIAQFLHLSEEESDFLLNLIQKERAGSVDLKKHFEKKIQATLKHRKEIQARVHSEKRLKESDQITYYSHWHYTAIHMGLMIKSLQTATQLSRFFGIAQERVRSVLDFLLSTGLAVEKGGHFSAGPTRIHLPSDSPLVHQHHTNWRMRAMDSLGAAHASSNDLHYSLIMSLSESAAEKIRAILLDSIQKAEPVLKAAADETVYTLTIDLFSLQKRG